MTDIKVQTQIFDNRIEQSLLLNTGISEEAFKVVTKILKLESEQLQQALVKLGWITTEKKEEMFEQLNLACNQISSGAYITALSTIRNILNNG